MIQQLLSRHQELFPFHTCTLLLSFVALPKILISIQFSSPAVLLKAIWALVGLLNLPNIFADAEINFISPIPQAPLPRVIFPFRTFASALIVMSTTRNIPHESATSFPLRHLMSQVLAVYSTLLASTERDPRLFPFRILTWTSCPRKKPGRDPELSIWRRLLTFYNNGACSYARLV